MRPTCSRSASGGRLSRGADRRASPSSSAKASFDYRAKRFVRAAHLPPLERHHGWKEIFSPELRAELTGRATARPARPLSRGVFGDGRRRAARAAAGRRPRRLPRRRRPAREDRPRLDGALARGARAVLRPVVASFAHALPTRHKVRALRKKVLLRKAAEPLLPRSIVSGKKRGLDPRRGVAARRARTFARETLSADTLKRRATSTPPWSRADRRARRRRDDRSRQLWGLLAFTLWHEHHVERVPSARRVSAREAELLRVELVRAVWVT